jgi:cytochrome c oxidase subunit 2
MEGIVDLHNYILFYLIIIFIFVIYFFVIISKTFYMNQIWPFFVEHYTLRSTNYEVRNVVHIPELETVWTIIPSVILMFVALPSFTLLYAMDEVIDPSITLKAIGHQWYWAYEYTDFPTELTYNSYMKSDDDLSLGDHRLLEVDQPVVLPINTHIRILVSSDDVLHSWAIPSLGVKVDAVPGRLNQLSVFMKRQGVFYGQCSELCGVNHGFMPISVRAVSLDVYVHWLEFFYRTRLTCYLVGIYNTYVI